MSSTSEPTNAQIPIIDISTPNDEVAAVLLAAASSYGFVFIKNNETVISNQSITEMFAMSRNFFQLPSEVKAKYSINSSESGKNRGWASMHMEKLDPAKQKARLAAAYAEVNHKLLICETAFNIGEYVDDKAQQPLPPTLESNEKRIGTFFESCHKLCRHILELIAVALKIDPKAGGKDWFSSRHDRSLGPSGSILRILYYPALPEATDYDPEVDIRAGAHSDYGSVTLLFQSPGQPGLEILKSQGTWVPVPVNPGNEAVLPILVNIGDLLSYWTNGLLKSTVHRVVFPKDARRGGEDRYSIAYFCHPLDEAKLEPIPSELVKKYASDEIDRNRSMTAKDHLESRLAATYGVKENGQAK